MGIQHFSNMAGRSQPLANPAKPGLQFGCRFSVTVASQGGLPPAVIGLQTPKPDKTASKGDTEAPNDTNPKTPSRINTPSDWIAPRDKRILDAIQQDWLSSQKKSVLGIIKSILGTIWPNNFNISVPAMFLGPKREPGHGKDLVYGGLVDSYNDYNLSIARMTPGNIQVHDVNGNKTLGDSPAHSEKRRQMQESLADITRESIRNGTRAMLIHQRFATRGDAIHQFEANIDGVKMGFFHNGSVDKVHQFDHKTIPLYKELTRSRSLDPNDQGAWESKNDSYRYFLLILANLKELNGGTLDAHAFRKNEKVARAIAETGLELAGGKPAEHPRQKDVPDKDKTHYQGVGYAGAFYFTRPDGSTFIMVLEGNKSPQEAVFYDPASQKHILKIDSEASQPESVFGKPKTADSWLQLPKDSAVVITSDPGEGEQKATYPFDLKQFVSDPNRRLPEGVLFQELFNGLPKAIRKQHENKEKEFGLPPLKINRL